MDVFRIIVPLDEEYSVDAQIDKNEKSAITEERLQIILKSMQKNIEYNTEEIADMVGLKTARTRELLKMLVNDDKIEAVGANRNRRYLKKFL